MRKMKMTMKMNLVLQTFNSFPKRNEIIKKNLISLKIKSDKYWIIMMKTTTKLIWMKFLQT